MNQDIVWHHHSVDHAARAKLKQHGSAVLWFTGLSGSGKSTLAGALEAALYQQGVHTYLLDGDNVRHGLCKDLGFSDADRQENIRRVGELSKLMADAGLVVLTAFISPFQRERDSVRELLPEGQFIEVFVDTPLAVCESRDPKGLYKKARAGEIKHFTGIDSAYEAPSHPEIRIDTSTQSIADSVTQLIEALKARGVLPC